jgi:hypothetical protein
MIRRKSNTTERITVVNKYKEDYDFYIGRGSPLGNPYSHLENTKAEYLVNTRDEACDKYEIWFEANKDKKLVKEYLTKIVLEAKKRPIKLGCFCKPNRCHGDTIKQYLDQQLGVNEMKTKTDTQTMDMFEIKSMTYSGIGSRKTPVSVMKVMTEIAQLLEQSGYKLYSGAAEGADSAFAWNTANKIEFIPWNGFNNCKSGVVTTSEQAMNLAKSLHPAWGRLSQGAKKLMARNCHQILGEDLNSPVDFVLCWTPDGAETSTTINTGGTGQAIRLAIQNQIPVINMANSNWYKRLNQLTGINYIPNYNRNGGIKELI